MAIDITYELTNEELDLNDIDLGRNQWHRVLKAFEESDNKMVVIKVKNMDERKLCVTSVKAWLKTHKRDYTVYTSKSKPQVYVIRSMAK